MPGLGAPYFSLSAPPSPLHDSSKVKKNLYSVLQYPESTYASCFLDRTNGSKE